MTAARITQSRGVFSMACAVELNIHLVAAAVAHSLPPESAAEKSLKLRQDNGRIEGAGRLAGEGGVQPPRG